MIRVFKSSSTTIELVELSLAAIQANHLRGCFTNLLFDTNILITIEQAYNSVDRHRRLEDEGVLRLAELVSENAHLGVFISPAAAYQELPSGRRADVEAAFQKFVNDYLPNFTEDPNSTKTSFGVGGSDPDVFFELPRSRQEIISCSYASLLAMNVIDLLDGLVAGERFDLYMDFCAEKLDLISLKEVVIARYVFAPDLGLVGDARKRKAAATQNFLRLKKGSGKDLSPADRVKRIAMNGANDLKLITAADLVSNAHEQISDERITHDVWIATSDEKLYEFCRACPGLVSSGQVGAPFRAIDLHDDIRRTRYWRETMDNLTRTLQERALTRRGAFEMGPIVDAAIELERYIDADQAADYFRSRSWR